MYQEIYDIKFNVRSLALCRYFYKCFNPYTNSINLWFIINFSTSFIQKITEFQSPTSSISPSHRIEDHWPNVTFDHIYRWIAQIHAGWTISSFLSLRPLQFSSYNCGCYFQNFEQYDWPFECISRRLCVRCKCAERHPNLVWIFDRLGWRACHAIPLRSLVSCWRPFPSWPDRNPFARQPGRSGYRSEF